MECEEDSWHSCCAANSVNVTRSSTRSQQCINFHLLEILELPNFAARPNMTDRSSNVSLIGKENEHLDARRRITRSASPLKRAGAEGSVDTTVAADGAAQRASAEVSCGVVAYCESTLMQDQPRSAPARASPPQPTFGADLHVFVRDTMREKVFGVTVGSAVGDAIGLYTEFLTKAQALALYPEASFRLTPPVTQHRTKTVECTLGPMCGPTIRIKHYRYCLASCIMDSTMRTILLRDCGCG